MNMKNISSRAYFALAVSDMQRARNFYEAVLEQEVDSFGGENNVNYKSGICLVDNYAELVAAEKWATQPTGVNLEIKTKSNSTQIIFEVDDLDYWVAKIKSTKGIEILHDVTEYIWGQRVLRFYDHDKHIIEVWDRLDAVAKRFIAQGRTVEEVAELLGDSVENIQRLLRDE